MGMPDRGKGTQMKRRLFTVLATSLFIASVGVGWAAKPNAEEAQVIAHFQKLGGRVTMDEQDPDRQVTSVDLRATNCDDAGLERLKALTRLRELELQSTGVTDAGLAHFGGLTQLQRLGLSRNAIITDAGVEHLKRLTQLRTLDLDGDSISDAGLEHLGCLTQLQYLGLMGTCITDAGDRKSVV